MLKTSFVVLSGCLLLAACGKSENTAEQPQNAVQGAPKPVFKVKYIDNTAIAGLALGGVQEGKTAEGKKQLTYPIEGLSEQNVLQLIGKHPNDLEVISGKCMETDDKGGKLTDYLVSHVALQPYQTGKRGYSAVQNGRYVLEIDSEGMFYFRRRHY